VEAVDADRLPLVRAAGELRAEGMTAWAATRSSWAWTTPAVDWTVWLPADAAGDSDDLVVALLSRAGSEHVASVA